MQQLLLDVVSVWVQGRDGLFELVCLGLVHDLEEELFLRRKVVVERRLGASDPLADVGHGGALKPHLLETLAGGLENCQALGLGLGFHIGQNRWLKSVWVLLEQQRWGAPAARMLS